jgi:hypothetical protein
MKNIDTIWNENLEKLQGEKGIQILVNDRKDVMSRLIKAFANVDGLPDDLNAPESYDNESAVDNYATALYDLFCEGAEFAEQMMVGRAVKRIYEAIQDEKGSARCPYKETGHTRGDF